MTSLHRQPLRAGTEIEYCGMLATVLRDDGGARLDVDCEGSRQSWFWTFEGTSCTVLTTPHGALSYDTFDSYVKDFPQGETFRAWVTHSGRNATHLMRLVDPPSAGSPHGGLPGNYLCVSVLGMRDGGLRLAAHDCDDGLMVRDFEPADVPALQQVLADMKALAPFSMWDAQKVFDFRWE